MSTRATKLLLATGDRPTLRQLSKFLDLFGYAVTQAADAPCALAAAEAHEPDVVVVDWDLPGTGGIEFCRSLRQLDPARDAAHVLILKSAPRGDELLQALQAGADDFLARPIVWGELLARLRAGARAAEALRGARQEATVDAVTGVSTRAALHDLMRTELAAAVDEGRPLSYVVVDVDSCRSVYQRYGRVAGDTALRTIAEQLVALCDRWEQVGQNHDDAFSVVLPGASDVRAANWAELARRAIAELDMQFAGQPLTITASFGVAARRDDRETPALLAARAARALQVAKWSGRNCVVRDGEFDEELRSWKDAAAPDRLFHGTVARDVMLPFPIVLEAEESVGVALGCLGDEPEASAPVVDGSGRLVGLVFRETLVEHAREGQSSRRIGEVAVTDVATYDVEADFQAIFDYFVHHDHGEVVVLEARRPAGLITREGLADLVEVPRTENPIPAVSAAGDDLLAAAQAAPLTH